MDILAWLLPHVVSFARSMTAALRLGDSPVSIKLYGDDLTNPTRITIHTLNTRSRQAHLLHAPVDVWPTIHPSHVARLFAKVAPPANGHSRRYIKRTTDGPIEHEDRKLPTTEHELWSKEVTRD